MIQKSCQGGESAFFIKLSSLSSISNVRAPPGLSGILYTRARVLYTKGDLPGPREEQWKVVRV